jgi:hypothetical protein
MKQHKTFLVSRCDVLEQESDVAVLRGKKFVIKEKFTIQICCVMDLILDMIYGDDCKLAS